MARRKISATIQHQVRQRANCLCEYCHASEQWQYVRFTVEHVLPLALGGTDDLDNLALACFHCNRRKWDKFKGIDPQTSLEVLLFNPRRMNWNRHFIWSADSISIVGLTPTGRATIAALALNRARVLNIRSADREIGRHPPSSDPIQKESL